jgi:hypothetical protein
MRNSAYVFSWLFFIINIMLVIALFLCWLVMAITNQPSESYVGVFCTMLSAMILLGMVHHVASLQIWKRPVLAGAVEFIPAILFIGLCLISGQVLFLALASPHLIVGSMTLLSADEKLEFVKLEDRMR